MKLDTCRDILSSSTRPIYAGIEFWSGRVIAGQVLSVNCA